MTDPEQAAIERGLASANPEDVHDAIVDIGKQYRRELADRVAPYLSSPSEFLREAAIRTLAFHLKLPAHKADAIRMLDSDPDPGVRQAAAMGLRVFAQRDPDLLQHLVNVALESHEDESVREAAFIAALVAAGVARDEFPMARWLPGFDRNADWPLLERTLRHAGHAVPPGVAERVAFPAIDRGSVERHVAVALDINEPDRVRAAAFRAALEAAGTDPGEPAREPAAVDFENNADWGLLAKVLFRTSIDLPAELGRRLAAQPTSGVVLTGEAARAFADAIGERSRKQRAERLAAAKAEAAVRGKEPFDLAKLEAMCDTSSHGRLDPVEVRHAELEERYYVWYRDVMTLVELAEKIHEWNRWM